MFEAFLKEEHARQYSGTDDDMADNFEKWLSELTVDNWYAYMVEFDELNPA